MPNAPAESKPALLDPYPDVADPPPPPEQGTDRAADEKAAAEKRARRVAADKLAAEKAEKQGVIIESRADLVNFQRCERGVKSACAKIRYEETPNTGGSAAPRARGSGVAGSEKASAMTGEEAQKAEASATETAARASSAAMGRASSAGEVMKAERADSLAGGPPSGSPGGAGAAAAPARGTVGGTVGGAGGNSSGAPQDGLDLGAAAASGFGASFAAQGLKMGAGPQAGQVLRADGKPASPAEVARLRRQIASDPKALMRRPDMFNVVDRNRVERLKSDFHAKPEEKGRAFKDIALTPGDRDFVHTKSCSPKLEKDCNKLIDKPYRKGEEVTPEDLDVIDDGLHPEDDPEDEEAEEEAEEDEGGAVAAQRSSGRTAAEIIAADDDRRAARAQRRRLRSRARLSGGAHVEAPPKPDGPQNGAPPPPSPWPTIVLILAAAAAAAGAWLRRARAANEEGPP